MYRMNLWTQQGKQWVGQIEKGAKIYIWSCVKQMASGNSLYHTGVSMAP